LNFFPRLLKNSKIAVLTGYGGAELDPAFPKEYKKFTADDPTPLLPEDHARVIREIPRDPEVKAIFKTIVGAGPLPPR